MCLAESTTWSPNDPIYVVAATQRDIKGVEAGGCTACPDGGVCRVHLSAPPSSASAFDVRAKGRLERIVLYRPIDPLVLTTPAGAPF